MPHEHDQLLYSSAQMWTSKNIRRVRNLLRLLHRSPEVPAGQMQMIVFTASWHRPPFWHGLFAHDTLSEKKQKLLCHIQIKKLGTEYLPSHNNGEN